MRAGPHAGTGQLRGLELQPGQGLGGGLQDLEPRSSGCGRFRQEAGGAGAGLVTLRRVTAPWALPETGQPDPLGPASQPENTTRQADMVSGQVPSPEAGTGHHDMLLSGRVTVWGMRAAPWRRQGEVGQGPVSMASDGPVVQELVLAGGGGLGALLP